jgi:acetyl esterase/lipase
MSTSRIVLRLAATAATVATVATAATAATVATALTLLAACDGGPITSATGVAYDPRHGDRGLMDVYSPEGAHDRPAVLIVHGGSWNSRGRGDHGQTAQRLAHSGYVASTIEYRLVPEGVFPGAAQDCFCALAFLRAHAAEYGLDPGRVALLGYSAGGQLVSLLGTHAEDAALQDPGCPAGTTFAPAAVIDGAGPADLRDLSGADAVKRFVGVDLGEHPEVWAAASPIEWVSADDPPFLIVHAERDLVVEVSQSERFRDRLRSSGVDARLLELPGGGHILNEGTDLAHEVVEVSLETPEAWLAIVDFLERTVGAP